MKPAEELSPQERFKWFVLDLAREVHPLGMPHGFVPAFFPDATMEDAHRIVSRAILDLSDEGLIVLFWAEESQGYKVGHEQLPDVEQLDRAEAIHVLEHPEVVDPPSRTLFFRNTKKGAEVLSALPPGAKTDLGPWTNPYTA